MSNFDKHSVLVVLTGEVNLHLFLEAVRQTRYVRDEHFTTFTDTYGVEEAIIPGKPQLLFIDLLLFDLDRTIEFVEQLKKKNDQLIVVLYSQYHKPPEIFDAYITDDDEDVIRKFKENTVRFLDPE